MPYRAEMNARNPTAIRFTRSSSSSSSAAASAAAAAPPNIPRGRTAESCQAEDHPAKCQNTWPSYRASRSGHSSSLSFSSSDALPSCGVLPSRQPPPSRKLFSTQQPTMLPADVLPLLLKSVAGGETGRISRELNWPATPPPPYSLSENTTL